MSAIYKRLKSKVRGLAGRTLLHTAAFSRVKESKAVIVAFHRVNDDLNDDLTCSTEKFREFCLFFKRYFHVIPLSEMVRRLDAKEPIGGTLAITFDDGYRDNFLNAAPILSEFGLHATFFVTTGFIEKNTVAWWDKIASVQPEWMTWDDVKALRASGFDIGAHTINHANLAKLSDDEAMVEIEGSRDALRAVLGETALQFAYPYGGIDNFNKAKRDLVKNAGFESCLSCHGGLNDRHSSKFDLKRIAISHWQAGPSQFVVDLVKG